MGAPLLSIAMPTRNRARLFERALGSVIGAAATVADDVEVTVSDGSDDDATGQVVERLLADWPAGPAALFAEPNRERALAGRIGELLDDPARRRRMGQAGRDRVRAILAWEHSAPVLLAAYERLWPALGGGRVVDLDPSARTGPGPPAQPRGNGARRPGAGWDLEGRAGATGDRGIRDRSTP